MSNYIDYPTIKNQPSQKALIKDWSMFCVKAAKASKIKKTKPK